MEYLDKEISKNTAQRTVIKFCVETRKTPVDTWKFMCKSEQARNCSSSIAFDWHKRFQDGRDFVQCEKRSGRPSSVTEMTEEC